MKIDKLPKLSDTFLIDDTYEVSIDTGRPIILTIKSKDETFQFKPKQMIVDGKDENGVVKYKLIHENSKHWEK